MVASRVGRRADAAYALTVAQQPKGWTPFKVGYVIVVVAVAGPLVFYAAGRWRAAFNYVYWLVVVPLIFGRPALRWWRNRRDRRAESDQPK